MAAFFCAWETFPPAPDMSKLAPVFSDHMVLQREMPVPVWGTAAAGEEVTRQVPHAGKKGSGNAAEWKVDQDQALIPLLRVAPMN